MAGVTMKIRKMIRKAMESIQLRRVPGHTWSPTVVARDRATTDAQRQVYRARVDRGKRGKLKRPMIICPARAYRRHPDKTTRALAIEQAKAQHRMWGPCVRGHWRTANPVQPWGKHWVYPVYTVEMKEQEEVVR